MSHPLANKNVIVTGAAAGIGAATLELMLSLRARVLATDIDVERGQALVKRLAPSAAGRVLFCRQDVADEGEWRAAFEQAVQHFGVVDVLVNNAGVSNQLVPLTETSLVEWRRVMSINLDGTFLGVREAIRHMTGRGGAIVNVSSVAGLVGSQLNGAYAPSKAGVLLLTKCAAMECAGMEPPIRVNAVLPGYIRTEMTEAISSTLGSEQFAQRIRRSMPLKRLGEAADIAEAIVFLASDQSKFATGTSLVIDGGWTAC